MPRARCSAMLLLTSYMHWYVVVGMFADFDFPCRSLRARTEALQRIRHAGMQCRMGHRKVLHRCTGAKRQPDEAASSQRSPMSSDEATSSGGGIPDAQTDQEPGTGASGSSPLIPQLYLFGRCLPANLATYFDCSVSCLMQYYVDTSHIFQNAHADSEVCCSCVSC